ncbi:hypothetical protein AZE42_11699 [Rhizopogon vesiculosus]|uniref:Uncharacterized protein n=1 Tax=Rhizopogon vesiculosus TaxID=180088 RepID=A0A1J8QH46_9AGAM|nr:hypothetical protein AZE42_11699 [Rhizopogon vesiculosus]
MDHWVSFIRSDLTSIATRCHVLENLFFGSSGLDVTDYEQSLLSEIIRSYRRLKHLTCPSLDSAAWKHLSNLPTLVKVEISRGLDKIQLDRDNIDFGPFLNVTTLHFNIKSASDIITLIQRSEFPSLKKFAMYVTILPWAEAEQLFTHCRGAKHAIPLKTLLFPPTAQRMNAHTNLGQRLNNSFVFRSCESCH